MTAATRATEAEPTETLETVFRHHHTPVFSAAYRITGNAADAEDALQTVFLRLLRRGDDLDLSPEPGAYLRRAAVNAALDIARTRNRRGALPLDDHEPPAGSTASPDRRQRDAELRRGMRQAVLGLSDKAAEIFTLRFFEGASNQDIARTLGMSENAVGVAVHRARNRVARDMRSFAGETR